MKGKLTGKIFNLRNIIVILSILIMAVGSGISIVEYNGKNVQTNLGEATTKITENTNWNPATIGLTPDDIIKEAISLANESKRHGSGCIGFINTVIRKANGGIANNKSTHLIDGCGGWDASTINGLSVSSSVKKYTTNAIMNNGSKWFDQFGGTSRLQPGDIIIGDGHAMIYLGQADSYTDLKNKLNSKYGKTFSEATIKWSSDYGTYYRDYLHSANGKAYGSTYWTIDVNGNDGFPRISDYDWGYAQGSSSNLNNMRLYRFIGTKSVNLNIVKQDMAGTEKSGAEFEYWVQDAVDPMPKNGTGNKGSKITLNVKYNGSKCVWIRETSAPSGYSIGLEQPIAIRIKVDSNGSISAQKIHDGGQGDIISTYFGGLKSGDKYTGHHYDELQNCGENISVIMKDPKQSSYHVKLGKKSSKDPTGNLIAGASYKVEINNEKEKTTKNITTSANEGDSFSGEVPITKEGDDDYKFTENDASGIGYATVKGTYGISVHKGVTDAGEYAITGIKYYSGSGSTLKEKEIKQGEKYWILNTKDAVIDSSVTKAQKENAIAYIELGQGGRAFNFIGIDPPISGQYDMKIVKKDETKDWQTGTNCSGGIGSAVFSAKQLKNVNYNGALEWSNILNEFDKIQGETVETSNNNWKVIFENVEITNKGLYDIYRINEDTPPSGYEKNTDTMCLKVTKVIKDEKYVIDKVELLNALNGDELNPDNEEVIGSYTISTYSNFKFKVAYNTTEILVTIADPPIPKGDYSINIVKRAMDDNSNDLSKVQEGVQFQVKQYKNQSSTAVNGHSKKDKVFVTTEANKATDIYFGNTTAVKIDNTEKYDSYEIQEIEEIEGFECSDLNFKFNVYKTKKDYDYIIDKVVVKTANGDVEIKRGTIKIDKDNKKVADNSNEYVVALTVEDNAIQIKWKDYRTGEYHLVARKINQSGLPMTGVKFKLAKSSNLDKNLFANDGAVNSENGNIGFTKVYTENINKDNINNIDSYVLTETEAPKNYSKLKYPIKIDVEKDKNLYVLSKVKIRVNNTDNVTEINRSERKTIDDVILENNQKVQLVIDINSIGTVTIRVSNEINNGSYNMKIIKKDEESDWKDLTINEKNGIANAQFKVEQILSLNSDELSKTLNESKNTSKLFKDNESKTNYNTKSVTTKINAWEDVYNNVEINKNTVELVDMYAITETNPPAGYNKNNNAMYLKVTKEISNDDTYVIKDVKLISATGQEVKESDNGIISTSKDSNKYWIDTNFKYKVVYNDTYIWVVYTDPPVDGSYKMKMVKRDISQNTDGESSLSKAQFTIKQYLNRENNENKIYDSEDNYGYTSGNSSKKIVELEKSQKQDIYYGDSSTIAISDTGKIDAYLIEETNPPEGYEKSDLKVLIQVHKKEAEIQGKKQYVIENIDVITRKGDSQNYISKMEGITKLMIRKDGNATNSAEDAIITISASENLIDVAWKDYPTGEYKIKAKKVSSNGNLTGATFSLTEQNKQENLFDKGGVVDKLGNTSTYTREISTDSLNKADKYILTETKAPDGYLKLKNPLTIEISKKKTVSENKTEYVIDKITLTSSDSNDKTGTIDVEKNKLLTLKGVLLEDNVTTVDITLEVTSTGSITIKVENKSVSGDYNYFIHKNVDGGSPNGIEFKVTGTYNGTLTAKDNGDTETRSIAITKDNINTNDELTIEENTNDSDILGLKNKIKLTIKKDIDSNSNKYRISHILVEELNTQNKAEKDISKTESTVITLDNVVIANSTYSEKSSIEIKVDLDNDGKQTIKITVNNKKVQPKNYTFRIKKVDLNNKPITGRKFNVYKINNDNTRTQIADHIETVAEGNDAIAKINKEFLLDSSIADRYAIQEVYDDNNNDWIKIENYEWILSINKTGSNLSTYKLATPTLKVSKIKGKEDDATQLKIANAATVSATDNTVTIIIDNQKDEEFNFKVKKVKLDGSELNGSKFTIVREATTYHKEEKITNVEPNTSQITTDKINQNEIFTFKIYEDESVSGYENLFIHDENTQGYLEVKIRVGSNGSVSKYGSLRWVNAVPEKDKILAKYFAETGKSDVVEINNKDVIINLPNISSTTSTGLSLNKHSYGNKSDKLAGATFTVRKAESTGNVTEVSTLIKLLNNHGKDLNGFTSSDSEDSAIDNLDDAVVDTTYIYEITETGELKFHNKKIEKAIVRIYVKEDKTTEASIAAVKLRDSSGYSAYSENIDYADRVSLDSLSGNNYKINWANDKAYVIQLLKKRLETDDIPDNWETLRGISAKFTIKQVSPTEVTLKDNEELDDYAIVNSDAKLTEYKYTIEETEASDGFQNLFKDKIITLTVNLNSDGTINEGNTKIKISNCSSSAHEKWLMKYIKLEVEDNNLKIYILNPKDKLGLKLLKTSGNSGDGIEGVTFSVSGTGSNGQYIGMGTYTTDKSGTFTIDNINILGHKNNFYFVEDSAPEGVTKLENSRIVLTVNAEGITAPSQITKDNLSIAIEMTGAGGTNKLEGLDVDFIGGNIVVTVPNPTREMSFNVVKNDNNGNRIRGCITDNDGNVISGVKLRIDKQEANSNSSMLYSGLIPEGAWNEGYTSIKANTEYIYTVRELATKRGYINVLSGYNIKLHLKTDANAKIKEINPTHLDQSDGNSYYEIVKLGTPKYSLDEVLSMISFKLEDITEKVQSVSISIVNPVGYRIQLNKTDLNGNPVKAVLEAKNISDESVRAVYARNESTARSAAMIYLKNGEEHNWQIKELSVSSPYVNILKDKVINVTTKWEDEALTVTKWDIDGDSNSKYKKYVDVITEKIDEVWTINVTIKDPIKVKVRLRKVGANNEDLSGATLTLKSSQTSKTTEIKDGNSVSDYLEEEISLLSGNKPNDFGFEVTESNTTSGHINVLKNKILYLRFVINEKSQISLGASFVINQENGTQGKLSSEYYWYDVSKDSDGSMLIDITIKNPMKYKFKVNKVDADGNPLEGAQIKINSSLSGNHYIDGKSSIEFIEEEGVSEGQLVSYYITEINTVGEGTSAETPYVNRLGNNRIFVLVKVDSDGNVEIQNAVGQVTNPDNSVSNVPLSLFGVKQLTTTTDEEGIKTVGIQLENPTSMKFELTKKQAGTNGKAIEGVEFRVEDSQGNREGTTNEKGIYSFKESNLKSGDYTFKIKETKTANDKYVNILENSYIQVTVHLSADGNLTFKDENKKFTMYNSDGTAVTDKEKLDLFTKYIDVKIDKTSKLNVLKVEIKNPVKLALEIEKDQTDGSGIDGAEFTIYDGISNKEFTDVTKDNGFIRVENDIVDPGIYKYEVREIKSASKKYTNIMENCKIVLWVKVNPNGDIELVDKNGKSFKAGVKKYYIYDLQDNDISDTTQGKLIMEDIRVGSNSDQQEIYISVENPTNIKLDLIKKDTEQGDITGSAFVVFRGDECVFGPETVSNDDIELNELNLSEGDYDYYITEAFSGNYYKYVNNIGDKFIKVSVRVKANGTVQIIDGESNIRPGYFEIYEGSVEDVSSAKLIDRNDDIYSYVKDVNVEKDADDVNIVKVTIENPTVYNFDITKHDAAKNSIKGSKFTAYREDEDGNITMVLNNEEPHSITESPMKAGKYIYYIAETKSPGTQYENILSGEYIKVYVKLDGDGKLHLTNSKFQDTEGYFETYKGNINTRDGQKIENSGFVKVDIPDPMGNIRYTLRITVENPVQYNVDIIKKDSDGNSLDNANFTAKRQKVTENKIEKVFNGTVGNGTEINERSMTAGNYIYYFTENSTPGVQYNNVLEGMYIKIYFKLNGDGTITITDSNFEKRDSYFELREGSIDDPKDSDTIYGTGGGKYYGLFSVNVVKSNSIYTIQVTVVNPVDYKVLLNKKVYGTGDNDYLSGANFTIISTRYGTEYTDNTDDNGNIGFTEEAVRAGIYKYIIRENSTPGDEFVNILEGKEIHVYVKVNGDGTINIVTKDGQVNSNAYYVYDIQSQKEISLTDEIQKCVSVGTSKNNGISQLDIKVKNPQKYKFSLVKKDKDTNEAMNGVKFKLKVVDTSSSTRVTLKDANTFKEINTDALETKNVDGVDGVISLDNLLIEKAGTYNFILHEESTDGIFDWLYKSHRSDIVIKVTFAIEDGKYIIKSAETTVGKTYVSGLSFETGIETGITNERIKGKYSLILNKIDSYTGKNLDGAVFDITVEKDGKEHKLYKSTNDVNSMEQILPANNVVVKDGKLEIKDIRIEEAKRDRQEVYTIILTEKTAPKGYMLLDKPIKLKITTNTTGENDDEKYIVESVELIEDGNHGLVTMNYDENKIEITAKNEYFDLSLRKSITSVEYPDKEDSKITEDETKNRVPNVVTDDLLADRSTTAIYNHDKNPVRVYKGQDVIYTLRVYNEGEIDGYAQEVTDHLPEWLEFVDDEFNRNNGWYLDENDLTNRTVRTTNLSKEYGISNGVDNLIKARDKVTGVLDYKEIQIKCRVSDDAKVKTVLTNIAEISLSKAENRTSETVDRDSVTNNVKVPDTAEGMSKYKDDELSKSYVPGQEDDDDFEKVIVEEFDLALRKYITAVNGEEMLRENQNTEDKNDKETADSDDENSNIDDVKYAREPIVNVSALKDGSSTTATYVHTKEPVEVSVDDIVRYTISVYNEGTVSGYASLIKDDIPEGLEFVKDSEVNKEFRWKLVDENDEETDDVTKAKYIVSDYLSKENGDDNLLNAFNGTKLDTKYVQVEFRVICKQDYPKIIENQAQISDDTDESGKPVTDRDSTPNEWKGEDDEDVEYIKVTYMDLALRKFITGVNKEEVTSRIPQVDATALINETGTTATYTHPKDPVLVHTNDIVTYTIRVYNEGSKDGYATGIKDDIPEGLEYLPDNEINKEYEWKLVDENDNEVTDVSKAKYVVTNYLSKENETKDRQNLMKAFDKETMTTPEYKDVKIAFKVTEPTTSDRILINYAQISEQTDKKGIHREDRDSTPNVWKGEDDEDIEKVRVLYFDLALRKWVTEAYVTENGQTRVIETGHHAEDDPEEVVKVDLRKSKLDSVVVKFKYHIRITNEGEIEGYAKEIKDRIPEGLEFELSDNPNWTMLDDGTIVTDELKDTLLQPGESAEVTIVLKWINSETNMGVKINVAEICKDYNDYGTPDIDSTPDNNVPGEDDIDDAPVMLTVKTGSEDLKYIALITIVLALLSGCVIALRKNIKRQYDVGDILRK